MQNIENLNKSELQELLKNLKVYKDLIKKVWNRWKKIYENIFNAQNQYLVEYYGELDKSYVLKEAKDIYKKMFNVDVIDSDIKLIKKQNLKWGIKIYLNDDLVDLSFLKFYNLLK
jgi:hypothetical protein